MSILKILNQLATDNSRKFKLSVLQVNSGNDLLKSVIFLALDPMTQFYIRKIPKYEMVIPDTMSLETALSELGVLSRREKTGHAGIDHLANILSNVSEDDAEVIKRVISKDLKCGVAEATVNEVWPNLVFEYPMMHSTAFSQKMAEKFCFPAYAQIKYDGMRFNALVKDGRCEFRSRNGKIIDLLGFLEDEFLQIANGEDLVFDGELLIEREGKILDRKTGNGILNKAVKGTISKEEAAMVKAVLWDMLKWKEFEKEWCELDYYNRFRRFEKIVMPKGIELVNNIKVDNLEESEKIFHEALEDGHEGIIIKALNYSWENKRSKGCLKFKSEKECDLLITGVIPGTGKYQGMIGALRCETSDGLLVVNVGSGLSDAERANEGDTYIGKILAVRYNERITSKSGGPISLFLPRAIEIRTDKTVADSVGEVK